MEKTKLFLETTATLEDVLEASDVIESCGGKGTLRYFNMHIQHSIWAIETKNLEEFKNQFKKTKHGKSATYREL